MAIQENPEQGSLFEEILPNGRIYPSRQLLDQPEYQGANNEGAAPREEMSTSSPTTPRKRIKTNLTLTPDLGQSTRHLRLLGYQPGEPVYLRTFAAKNLNRFLPENNQVGGYNSLGSLHQLPKKQDGNRAQYFVVNGQGQKKGDITFGRAVFAEFDGISQEEQLLRIADGCGSFQVKDCNEAGRFWRRFWYVIGSEP